MKRFATLGLLVACSSSGATKSETHATLQVTFGSTTPVTLDTEVTSNTTSSRLMMQSSDGRTTVFVSLATPLAESEIALSADAQVASIWAKQDPMLPLIATSGSLTVESSSGLLNFVFNSISKPADSAGTSLFITGSMDGVSSAP